MYFTCNQNTGQFFVSSVANKYDHFYTSPKFRYTAILYYAQVREMIKFLYLRLPHIEYNKLTCQTSDVTENLLNLERDISIWYCGRNGHTIWVFKDLFSNRWYAENNIQSDGGIYYLISYVLPMHIMQYLDDNPNHTKQKFDLILTIFHLMVNYFKPGQIRPWGHSYLLALT